MDHSLGVQFIYIFIITILNKLNMIPIYHTYKYISKTEKSIVPNLIPILTTISELDGLTRRN